MELVRAAYAILQTNPAFNPWREGLVELLCNNFVPKTLNKQGVHIRLLHYVPRPARVAPKETMHKW